MPQFKVKMFTTKPNNFGVPSSETFHNATTESSGGPYIIEIANIVYNQVETIPF